MQTEDASLLARFAVQTLAVFSKASPPPAFWTRVRRARRRRRNRRRHPRARGCRGCRGPATRIPTARPAGCSADRAIPMRLTQHPKAGLQTQAHVGVRHGAPSRPVACWSAAEAVVAPRRRRPVAGPVAEAVEAVARTHPVAAATQRNRMDPSADATPVQWVAGKHAASPEAAAPVAADRRSLEAAVAGLHHCWCWHWPSRKPNTQDRPPNDQPAGSARTSRSFSAR
mmetsp:Transcript_4916/g.12346  ORF Transcript_4916/g.12346 Transcript_4916/m.12346 type:complete len:227 (+) Transcript_4916:60-740(+)